MEKIYDGVLKEGSTMDYKAVIAELQKMIDLKDKYHAKGEPERSAIAAINELIARVHILERELSDLQAGAGPGPGESQGLNPVSQAHGEDPDAYLVRELY